MPQATLSGILNINKPIGWTSHDVVKYVRKHSGIRKVGHAGTLDPMATGVLLVCVGRATRLIEYLVRGRKVYRATILFGQATNTYDADGEIVSWADPSDLSIATIEAAFQTFIGQINQTPPIFSAIKKNGIPAYKLARQGASVKLEPRPVQIDKIEPVAWHLPEVVVDVTCQAGTYIRSLAHDLGQYLQVGAHLTGLIRLMSGTWRVEDALSLTDIEKAALAHQLDKIIHPKEQALSDLPKLILSSTQIQAVRFGQAIVSEVPISAPILAGYDAQQRLVAILQGDPGGQLRPKKVFL